MPQYAGREAFLSILLDEGIDYLFGNPGTTELPIVAALPELPQLQYVLCLLYTSPSPRDKRQSRMPSSA